MKIEQVMASESQYLRMRSEILKKFKKMSKKTSNLEVGLAKKVKKLK